MGESAGQRDEKEAFVPENPDELYGKLIKLIRENMTENDVSLVEKAYFIAKRLMRVSSDSPASLI